jgi:hypothetical protein
MCHSLRVKAIYLLVLLLFLCGTPVSFGQLTFGIGSISPSEEQGVVTCTIHIQPSATPVTVDYRTLSDTATAGVDFIPVSGTLTFQPGQTTKDFDVTILSDSLVEGREYFTVDLFNPSTGYLPFSASIPIPDSERGYFIAASDTPENADFRGNRGDSFRRI